MPFKDAGAGDEKTGKTSSSPPGETRRRDGDEDELVSTRKTGRRDGDKETARLHREIGRPTIK